MLVPNSLREAALGARGAALARHARHRPAADDRRHRSPARHSQSRASRARRRRCSSPARSSGHGDARGTRPMPSRRSRSRSSSCPSQADPTRTTRMAWAAALVLILFILFASLERALARDSQPSQARAALGDEPAEGRNRVRVEYDRARRARRAEASAAAAARAARTGLRHPGPDRDLRHQAGLQGRVDGGLQEPRHRDHRAVGLRQEHLHPLPQPDERPRPELPPDGDDPLPRPGHRGQGRRPGRGAPHDRHGLPAAEPVPEVDPRQRRLGPEGARDEGQPRRARREGADAGGSLGRGEGPAEGERARPLRRAAAAPLHRARHRGRAGRRPHGRAGLGARSRSRPRRSSSSCTSSRASTRS